MSTPTPEPMTLAQAVAWMDGGRDAAREQFDARWQAVKVAHPANACGIHELPIEDYARYFFDRERTFAPAAEAFAVLLAHARATLARPTPAPGEESGSDTARAIAALREHAERLDPRPSQQTCALVLAALDAAQADRARLTDADVSEPEAIAKMRRMPNAGSTSYLSHEERQQVVAFVDALIRERDAYKSVAASAAIGLVRAQPEYPHAQYAALAARTPDAEGGR